MGTLVSFASSLDPLLLIVVRSPHRILPSQWGGPTLSGIFINYCREDSEATRAGPAANDTEYSVTLVKNPRLTASRALSTWESRKLGGVDHFGERRQLDAGFSCYRRRTTLQVHQQGHEHRALGNLQRESATDAFHSAHSEWRHKVCS